MRRKDREVTDFNEIKEIIEECDTIRIGLNDGSYPYIVPLNFGYEIQGEQIYFYIHGAMAGKKYELIKDLKACSFEMDCAHQVECLYDSKDVTMRYKCVMGKASITLLDENEKEQAMDIMMSKYEKTRDFVYDHTRLQGIMIARLKVLELTAKINPITKLTFD